jgi:hypothetical protein
MLASYEKGKKTALAGAKRGNKYNAQKVGDSDSKKEDRRLQDLRLMEKAGEISDLRHHVTYSLHVNGIHICDYECDYTYNQRRAGKPAVFVVEDAKGKRTPVYLLKKRLMKACLGIDIYET